MPELDPSRAGEATASTGPPSLPEHASNRLGLSTIRDRLPTLTRGAYFTGLRWIANAYWVGGTALSIGAQEGLGVPWPVATAGVATVVAAAEYRSSRIATRLLPPDETVVRPAYPTRSRVRRAAVATTKEVVATGYATWAGSGSAVEINNELGLPSTDSRRLRQSGAYGLGVGMWSLPFMRETAVSAIEYALENPVEATTAGAAGSLAVYGAMKAGRKAISHCWEHFVTNRSVDTSINGFDG